ncbi:sugar phosphate isomerase/epimerase family protein [Kineosporia babensis]|uniref:Sugar phosphate isomerase/epimerase n=1 Tax=Kineosporia babensis TaxID=499548 RepID=A0A9X1NDX2_9ACTN|nr:sugar phosphate isomerase/epimerase family protein [Kineosporia babensis]MCD5312308.1 sugar phosphate isomerase/epimerase [Kineosporia babensis]
MSLRIALATGPAPLEDAFAWAREQGLRELEFSCQHPLNRPPAFDRARIDGLRERAGRDGFRAVLHTDSAVNVAEITPGIRAAVVTHLNGYVDLAAGLGCPVVIVHGGYWFGDDHAARVEQAAHTLALVADHAADLGITLALENMNVLPAEAEIRYLGCTAEEVLQILQGHPALTACVDLGHAHLLPGGAHDFVQAMAGRIGHVQLTDNDGVIDRHLALGAGTLDVGAALNQLEALGYQGQVAIELDSRQDQLTSLKYLAAAGQFTALALEDQAHQAFGVDR